MPIDRAKGGNVVRTCVAEFARRERMSITITPEGTRGKVKEWKLGFYYIATEAGRPHRPRGAQLFDEALVMIMAPFTPTGTPPPTCRRSRRCIRPSMARHPENF